LKPVHYSTQNIGDIILRGVNIHRIKIGDILYLRLDFLNLKIEEEIEVEIEVVAIENGKYYIKTLRAFKRIDERTRVIIPDGFTQYFKLGDLNDTIFKTPKYL